MLGLQYTTMALNHWKKWRPKMVAEMRKAGKLNQRVQEASRLASEQIANLMSKGLQLHGAEELVLPKQSFFRRKKTSSARPEKPDGRARRDDRRGNPG